MTGHLSTVLRFLKRPMSQRKTFEAEVATLEQSKGMFERLK